MKGDLPVEHTEQLDFESLPRTLRLLQGEQVVFLLSLGVVARVQARGTLRLYAYGEVGTGVAIDPDARILLTESDFQSARLSTLDGNDYFTLAIRSAMSTS